MSATLRKSTLIASTLIAAVSWCSLAGQAQTVSGQTQPDPLIERTSNQVAGFLDFFSETNCTEHVLQEKLGDKGNVLEKQNSTFDYLVILSTDGGDLSLTESRIVPKDEKENKKPKSPLLISNGFSMLFLVFHPYYADSFQFTRTGQDVLNGETLDKVHFQHIPGMRSPAALAVSGREYPLDLSGTAWINPSTGVIVKLTASVDSGMEDVGLRSLHSEMDFGKVTFHDSTTAYWLPSRVIVDVESRHQHWRNTHEFTAYRRFSVNTKQQVATK